jgi:hypothetical protein
MIKRITFDTYPIDLYVLINETDEDILAYVGKYNLTNYEDLLNFNETEDAIFVWEDDSSEIYLRFRDLTKPELIAHEAFHATAYIMRHVGIRFSKSSEEAYAYLLEYIIENIND